MAESFGVEGQVCDVGTIDSIPLNEEDVHSFNPMLALAHRKQKLFCDCAFITKVPYTDYWIDGVYYNPLGIPPEVEMAAHVDPDKAGADSSMGPSSAIAAAEMAMAQDRAIAALPPGPARDMLIRMRAAQTQAALQQSGPDLSVPAGGAATGPKTTEIPTGFITPPTVTLAAGATSATVVPKAATAPAGTPSDIDPYLNPQNGFKTWPWPQGRPPPAGWAPGMGYTISAGVLRLGINNFGDAAFGGARGGVGAMERMFYGVGRIRAARFAHARARALHPLGDFGDFGEGSNGAFGAAAPVQWTRAVYAKWPGWTWPQGKPPPADWVPNPADVAADKAHVDAENAAQDRLMAVGLGPGTGFIDPQGNIQTYPGPAQIANLPPVRLDQLGFSEPELFLKDRESAVKAHLAAHPGSRVTRMEQKVANVKTTDWDRCMRETVIPGIPPWTEVGAGFRGIPKRNGGFFYDLSRAFSIDERDFIAKNLWSTFWYNLPKYLILIVKQIFFQPWMAVVEAATGVPVILLPIIQRDYYIQVLGPCPSVEYVVQQAAQGRKVVWGQEALTKAQKDELAALIADPVIKGFPNLVGVIGDYFGQCGVGVNVLCGIGVILQRGAKMFILDGSVHQLQTPSLKAIIYFLAGSGEDLPKVITGLSALIAPTPDNIWRAVIPIFNLIRDGSQEAVNDLTQEINKYHMNEPMAVALNDIKGAMDVLNIIGKLGADIGNGVRQGLPIDKVIDKAAVDILGFSPDLYLYLLNDVTPDSTGRSPTKAMRMRNAQAYVARSMHQNAGTTEDLLGRINGIGNTLDSIQQTLYDLNQKLGGALDPVYQEVKKLVPVIKAAQVVARDSAAAMHAQMMQNPVTAPIPDDQPAAAPPTPQAGSAGPKTPTTQPGPPAVQPPVASRPPDATKAPSLAILGAAGAAGFLVGGPIGAAGGVAVASYLTKAPAQAPALSGFARARFTGAGRGTPRVRNGRFHGVAFGGDPLQGPAGRIDPDSPLGKQRLYAARGGDLLGPSFRGADQRDHGAPRIRTRPAKRAVRLEGFNEDVVAPPEQLAVPTTGPKSLTEMSTLEIAQHLEDEQRKEEAAKAAYLANAAEISQRIDGYQAEHLASFGFVDPQLEARRATRSTSPRRAAMSSYARNNRGRGFRGFGAPLVEEGTKWWDTTTPPLLPSVSADEALIPVGTDPLQASFAPAGGGTPASMSVATQAATLFNPVAAGAGAGAFLSPDGHTLLSPEQAAALQDAGQLPTTSYATPDAPPPPSGGIAGGIGLGSKGKLAVAAAALAGLFFYSRSK